MTTLPGAAARAEAPGRGGRARAQDVDRHVGARLRERRLALGLTQQRTAELVGVNYQQAHKYETGANRITAGQLHAIATALDVEVGHFFEGLDGGDAPGPGPEPRGRPVLGLARDFAAIRDRRHQEALCRLARALAGLDGDRDR